MRQVRAGLRPLADRAQGRSSCSTRHPRSTRRPTRPSRSRRSSRTRTCRPSPRRPPSSRCCLPTEPCVDRAGVDRATRLALFRLVLLQRLFEERALTLYRQGRIAGSFYDGRGQEAVAAAAGLALGPDDVVAPLNRELATHFARGVTPADAFRNFLGRADSPTRGRDGNMHFGVPALGVFPLVSMLGDLASVTVGAALAFARRGEPRVALTFLGEGAFSVGDTHEALGLAGVWQVPAVFVLQRNQYSYSTPVARQMANTVLAERIDGRLVDPLRDGRRHGRRRHLRGDLGGRRASTGGSRPAGGRGGHAAHPRPRRARRRAIRARRAARRVRDPRSRRAARRAPAGGRRRSARPRRARRRRPHRDRRRPRRGGAVTFPGSRDHRARSLGGAARLTPDARERRSLPLQCVR